MTNLTVAVIGLFRFYQLYNQLISYLDKNKILSDSQFGFRKRHSTSTSLLNATNNWLLNIDKGLINGVLFLDLRKAFDTVDHNVLINKLKMYGIKNSALNWFISYLDKRYQCTFSKSAGYPIFG